MNRSLAMNSSRFGGNASVFGGRQATRLTASTEKLNQAPTVVVLDDSGNDVTPLPLVVRTQKTTEAGKVGEKSSNASHASFAKSSVADVLNNMDAMTAGKSFNASTMGRSMMGNENASMGAFGDKSISVVSGGDLYSVGDGKGAKAKYYLAPSKPSIPSPDSMVHVTLTETKTLTIVDIPSIAISSENTDQLMQIKAMNERYEKIVETRPMNENLMDRDTQTIAIPQKSKEMQAADPSKVTDACMVNDWIIYDDIAQEEAGEHDPKFEEVLIDEAAETRPSDSASLNNSLNSSTASYDQSRSSMNMSQTSQSMGMSQVSQSMNMSTAGSKTAPTAGAPNEKEIDKEKLFAQINHENLLKSLSIMERIVMSKTYFSVHFMYRNLPAIEDHGDNDEEEEDVMLKIKNYRDALKRAAALGAKFGMYVPAFKLLWNMRCELSKGRSVSHICYNKKNRGIVAVGYGPSKDNDPKLPPGLVLCWSLKNPEWPERVYPTQSAVTSLDFSSVNPSLLAIGLANGSMCIYDVRRKHNPAIMDNSSMIGKHRDAIWDVRWVDEEQVREDDESKGQVVVTISTDGRVTQWANRKGNEYKDIMGLKKVNIQEKVIQNGEGSVQKNEKAGNSLLSRTDGGLSIDFNPLDSNNYLVSTEEGYVHLCSRSYNEQYMGTYSEHAGPVYKARWSPFCPHLFLTCSSDWTIRLWNELQYEESILQFHHEKGGYTDLVWSPISSTVFGAISSCGHVEIWDLQFSVLDPAIKHSIIDKNITTLAFAEDTPVVLLGDNQGAVTIYRLENMASRLEVNPSEEVREEQVNTLKNLVSESLKKQQQQHEKSSQGK